MWMTRRIATAALLATGSCLLLADVAAAAGKLKLSVVDAATGRPLAFRLHLRNERQIPVKVPSVPNGHDHASIPGAVQLELFRGNYFFDIEHGPEYQTRNGHFTINDGADDEKTVELKRIVDMPKEFWWSADLDVRRPPRELETAMLADDLHLVPLTTWTNRRSDWTKAKPPSEPITAFDDDRYYHLLGGGDDRDGGPIGLFNLPRVPSLPAIPKTIVGLTPALRELKATNEELWIDIAQPTAWDLPILVGLGLADSYRVLPSSLARDKVDVTPFGKPFDRSLYAGRDGPTRFACDVYFHLLNCGLKIVPSAGSGSGLAPNPIGYNRVYTAVQRSQLDYRSWWEYYKLGRTMVTNGPILQPWANAMLPGATFTANAGETLTLDLLTNLTTRDPIEYLEVVKDGKVLHSVRLADWAKSGHFPTTSFTESGWCLIRVFALHKSTVRVAMTAPWYVEIGGKPRVSKASAQFFLDWLEERAKILQIADEKERAAADAAIVEARAFWQKKIAEANAP